MLHTRLPGRRVMDALGLLAVAALALAASGCAKVKFVDQGRCKSGFDYFPPKPYLLVEPDKDGNRKATLIMLPDVEHPRRVQYCPGIGTVDFSFDITNGMIAKFGAKVDTKVPEMIKEITTGVSTLATAAKTLASISAATKEPGVTTYAVKRVQDAVKLVTAASDALAKAAAKDPVLKAEKDNLAGLAGELANLERLVVKDGEDPAAKLAEHKVAVGTVLAKLKMSSIALEVVRDNAKGSVESKVAATQALVHLKKAISLLTMHVTPRPEIELYEIRWDPDAKEVQFRLVESL